MGRTFQCRKLRDTNFDAIFLNVPAGSPSVGVRSFCGLSFLTDDTADNSLPPRPSNSGVAVSFQPGCFVFPFAKAGPTYPGGWSLLAWMGLCRTRALASGGGERTAACPKQPTGTFPTQVVVFVVVLSCGRGLCMLQYHLLNARMRNIVSVPSYCMQPPVSSLGAHICPFCVRYGTSTGCGVYNACHNANHMCEVCALHQCYHYGLRCRLIMMLVGSQTQPSSFLRFGLGSGVA